MSEKSQLWKQRLKAVHEIASALSADKLENHTLQDVEKSLAFCMKTFDEDFELSVKKLSRMLAFSEFEEDKGRYIASLRNTLAEWQAGAGPSIPAMIAGWYECRGFDGASDECDPFITASLAAGLLAEIPVPASEIKGYHEHPHFREVALLSMIALSGEEYLNDTMFPISVAAKQVTISAAHDLFHTGKDNASNGQYVRYYLEQRSFDAFEPYLRYCGLPEEYIQDVHTAILITEIMTGEGREYSAHQYLRQAYEYHFQGQGRPDLPDELNLLFSEEPGIRDTRGRELTLTCIRMQESDTICSSLDEDSFDFRFRQLHTENPDKYPESPKEGSFIGFVHYIFTSGKKEISQRPEFLSPFYRAWFQDRLDKVCEGAAGGILPK